MIRFILFIVIFVIFLGFIVLNLDNRCDISFGFTTLADVPVFLSALFSFMLGMLFAVPVAFFLGRKRKKSLLSEKSKKGAAAPEPSLESEIKQENSPYGID